MSEADVASVPPDGDEKPRGPGTEERAPNPRAALSLSLRTTIGAQLLLAISGIMLARALGQNDRGELAAAMVWPTVIAGFGALGLLEAVTYHVARFPAHARSWVGSGLALALMQSVVAVGAAVFVIPLALSSHEQSVVDSSLIYVAAIPLILAGVVFLGALNGLHSYRAFSAVRLSVFTLMVASQTALIVAAASGVRSIVIGFLIAQAGMAILGAVLTLRRLGKPVPDRSRIRTLFGYGLRTASGSASSFLNQRLDQLVLSAFLSAGQLGLYVVAVNLTQVPGLIGNAVGYATLPNVAATETQTERLQLARRFVGLAFGLSVALAIPILVLAPQLVSLLFGSAFDGAVPVARLLALGAVAFATARALEAVLRALGRPLDAGIAEGVALGGTVVGLATLIGPLGIEGAALTSLAAYGIAAGWMLVRASRMLGTTPWTLLTPDRAALRGAADAVRGLAARRMPTGGSGGPKD